MKNRSHYPIKEWDPEYIWTNRMFRTGRLRTNLILQLILLESWRLRMSLSLLSKQISFMISFLSLFPIMLTEKYKFSH